MSVIKQIPGSILVAYVDKQAGITFKAKSSHVGYAKIPCFVTLHCQGIIGKWPKAFEQ